MKHRFLFIAVMFVAAFALVFNSDDSAQNLMAQPGRGKQGMGPQQAARAVNKETAKAVIIRTHMVIKRAYQVSKNKNTIQANKQNLRRAVAHNKIARNIYKAQGVYLNAIRHSLRGRQLAHQVLQANQQTPTAVEQVTQDESAMIQGDNVAQLDTATDSVQMQDAEVETEALKDVDI